MGQLWKWLRRQIMGRMLTAMVLMAWMCNAAAETQPGDAAGSARLEPLPIDEAIAYHEPVGRSRVNLSPDGLWLAFTSMRSDDTLPKDTNLYSATGVPFTDGAGRMRALLTHTQTGEVIALCADSASSWAPAWSPDGRRVAFYCDAGGQAGLWVWELGTREANRFPAVIVRPGFIFEAPRWSPNGRQLAVKILPKDMSVAEANARLPAFDESIRLPTAKSGGPPVRVLRSQDKDDKNVAAHSASAQDLDDPGAPMRVAELALLDLDTHEVQRLVAGVDSHWWEFSPDGRFVAYTANRGVLRNSQQSVADLKVVDLASSRQRVLVSQFPTYYAHHISWSPDSRRLAYRTVDPYGKSLGEIFVVSVEGGEPHRLGTMTFPARSERPPYWDMRNEHLYLPKDETLWRLDVATGKAAEVARLPGRTLRNIVARPGANTFWSPDGGRSLVVSAAYMEQGVRQSGFYQIELATGSSKKLVEEAREYSTTYTQDVAKGLILYVVQDMQHPPEVWGLDTATGRSKRLSQLSNRLDRYALGEARRVEWTTTRGEALAGTLLLPGHYESGTRYPLVAWIYGGSQGSQSVNTYGIWGDTATFNFQVLASRGYAVFHPDAPQRVGTPMQDLVDTVMPGVDKLIELGIADPDRLAVMGQSYGSYCTLAMITHTTRFKAAVITAVMNPDLVGAYLRMGPDGTASNTGYYEQGQGKLGGTPWEYRERYIENSPVFFFDKITTPLLIGQGDQDETTPPYQGANSVFVALLRLGKEVEYRLYRGEEHVIQRPANVRDFWERRLEFLADHLNLKLDDHGAIVFDGGRAQSRGGDALTATPAKNVH